MDDVDDVIRSLLAGAAALAMLCAASSAPSISIDGAFVRAQTLDGAAIAAFPHVSLTVTEEHTSTAATYSGVLLATLLGSAGTPTGGAVKGAPARSYVVVHAADGYAAVFSLAELDTSELSCAPVLADRRNGIAIAPQLGPFRLLAPCDKTHARWVHEVTGFTIVTLADTK